MKEQSLNEILSETVFNHVFESFVIQKYEEKFVRPPIYLSLGTEHIPPTLKYAFTDFGLSLKDFAIFPQHRCHSYYLSFNYLNSNFYRCIGFWLRCRSNISIMAVNEFILLS